MFEHVVLATDFSSDRLETRAAWLSRFGTQRLTLAHILSTRYPQSPQETQRELVASQLADAVNRLRDRTGMAVDSIVRDGLPGAELSAIAAELKADLLLLGTHDHGRLHRFLLGSTALDAARLTRTPLWLEPMHGDPDLSLSMLLLATDGSCAVTAAETLCSGLAGHYEQCLAVTVLPLGLAMARELAAAESHLAELAGRIGGLETQVIDDDPRHGLTQIAARCAASLVVIGQRGRTAIESLLLGSTAEAICRQAGRPVLLVPKPA